MFGEIEISCNGPEDCPGQVCCGDYDNFQGHYTGIYCQDTCTPGQTKVVMCEGMPTVCDSFGYMCYPSQVLGGGYSYCNP
jgi:hypothetical protein